MIDIGQICSIFGDQRANYIEAFMFNLELYYLTLTRFQLACDRDKDSHANLKSLNKYLFSKGKDEQISRIVLVLLLLTVNKLMPVIMKRRLNFNRLTFSLQFF